MKIMWAVWCLVVSTSAMVILDLAPAYLTTKSAAFVLASPTPLPLSPFLWDKQASRKVKQNFIEKGDRPVSSSLPRSLPSKDNQATRKVKQKISTKEGQPASTPLPLSSPSNGMHTQRQVKQKVIVKDKPPMRLSGNPFSDTSVNLASLPVDTQPELDLVTGHSQANDVAFQAEDLTTEEIIPERQHKEEINDPVNKDGTDEHKQDVQHQTVQLSAKLEVSASEKSLSAVNFSLASAQTLQNLQQGAAPSCRSDLMSSSVVESFCAGNEWSCQGKCGQFRHLPCSCHINCAIYRTCCLDFQQQCWLGKSKCEAFDMNGRFDVEKSVKLISVFSGFRPIRVFDPQSSLSTSSPLAAQDSALRRNEQGKINVSTVDESSTVSVQKTMDNLVSPFVTPQTASTHLTDSLNMPPESSAYETSTALYSPTPLSVEAVSEYRAAITAGTLSSLQNRPTQLDVTDASPSKFNGSTSTTAFDTVSPSSPLTTDIESRAVVMKSYLNADLEIPVSRCSPTIQALLIDYCPNATNPKDPSLHKCVSLRPTVMMEIIPVTDTITGLHFRNQYCKTCWWKYLAKMNEEMETCTGGESFGLRAPEAWELELLVSSKSRPKDDSFLQDILDFIVGDPAAMVWKSPEKYPHHPCTFDDQICPSCRNTDGILTQSNQCESSYSYVEVGDIVYPNKLCAACQAVNEYINQISAAHISSDSVANYLNTLECSVPRNINLTTLTHEPGTRAAMKWSKERGVWLFENKGARNDNGTGIVPRDAQLSWKEMECNVYSCKVIFCSREAWEKNGRCMMDKVPATILLTFCLGYVNDSFCRTDKTQLADEVSDFFQFELQRSLLEVLLQNVPLMREVSNEYIETGVERYKRHILMPFWFAYDAQKDFSSSNNTTNITTLFSSVMKNMQRLDYDGWVKICFRMDQYKIAAKQMYEDSTVSCMSPGENFIIFQGIPSSALTPLPLSTFGLFFVDLFAMILYFLY